MNKMFLIHPYEIPLNNHLKIYYIFIFLNNYKNLIKPANYFKYIIIFYLLNIIQVKY